MKNIAHKCQHRGSNVPITYMDNMQCSLKPPTSVTGPDLLLILALCLQTDAYMS